MAQCKIVKPSTPKFQPVTIQLTLETQEELNALWSVCARLSNYISDEAKKGTASKPFITADWDNISCNIATEIREHL